MASNYKVKVRGEIEECAAPLTDAPRQADVGVFEWVISAQQAQSIDECEQIVLQTNYEALRDALAHHLSAVSQQLPCPQDTTRDENAPNKWGSPESRTCRGGYFRSRAVGCVMPC